MKHFVHKKAKQISITNQISIRTQCSHFGLVVLLEIKDKIQTGVFLGLYINRSSGEVFNFNFFQHIPAYYKQIVW